MRINVYDLFFILQVQNLLITVLMGVGGNVILTVTQAALWFAGEGANWKQYSRPLHCRLDMGRGCPVVTSTPVGGISTSDFTSLSLADLVFQMRKVTNEWFLPHRCCKD